MVLIPTVHTAQPASKTKAKQRYLRRKKERKKIAKVATSSKSKIKTVPADLGDIDEDEAVVEGQLPVPHKAVKRPKKRRKVEQELEAVTTDSSQDDATEPISDGEEGATDMVVETEPADPVARSPPPSLGLPSFPTLTQPKAPSKSALALQGLDHALAGAEIVEPATVLSISDEELDTVTGLSLKTRKRLKELGITELFAVQTTLLPFLLPQELSLRALYLPYNPPRDVCVSAPTGSGKTLAYVLPIIEILSSRIITRLRALIVLPTRDLVVQVRETFEAVGKGRGIKIGTATGQHSFAHEQSQLVDSKDSRLIGGSSKIDILICTPGRLIDHLNSTPNFSLQHLRFLVIDEADRLLAQSFQDWLAQVLAATRVPHRPESISKDLEPPTLDSLSISGLPHPDAVAPAFMHLLPCYDVPPFSDKKESSCQKLLFSATLTSDPGKLAALGLRDPKYFVVQGGASQVGNDGALNVAMEKFTVPTTLKEHFIVCGSAQKPLILFHLVHKHGVKNALVFTKSAESTLRLVQLFDFFEKERAKTGDGDPIVIRPYSSDLGIAERKSILDKFKCQEVHILVCSDLISRGIDISHVSHVVSYDAPVDMRKYVHRVGRTARAGREGDAWTLVEEQEARYFKAMLKEAEHLDKVKRVKVADHDISPLLPVYEASLSQLKEIYAR